MKKQAPRKSQPASYGASFAFVFALGCLLGAWLHPLLEKEGGITSDPLSHVDSHASSSTPFHSPIRVCFSPEGRCTKKIIKEIEGAGVSIFVMAYSFTSPEIAEALIGAFQKGLDVRVLIDRSQLRDKRSQCWHLYDAGIPLWVDPAPGIAHNKTMIFDGRCVLTGSFNFTRSAESRNAENILVIDDGNLAHLYTRNWLARTQRSQKVTGVMRRPLK